MKYQSGFTLIEMVLVIIIVSVVSVPLFNLFSQASRSLITNESIQTATQLAQERAELVLAARRLQGFASPAVAVGTAVENLPPPYAAFTRTTTISQPALPPNGCPTGAICKQVDINVSQAGQMAAQAAFVLVNY